MADELRLETKCYDATEYGYLYGLNQKIPDDEFEKKRFTGFCYSTKDKAIEAWNDRVDVGEWRISPWRS